MVGQYRLLGRLGAGGMGQVFLGSSRGGRHVAVKLILAEHADDPHFRQRFAREIDAARRVGGYHTAPVVDADPWADPPWMVTAYIKGRSLHDTVRTTGPLPVPEVRRLGAALAEGLAAIHREGLIHRDLKPGNIIMADDGPRIIDFGVVRSLNAGSMTRTGGLVGTPAYMSPEQVAGRRVTPASDIFALGGVLTFAATGQSPFAADTIAAIVYRIARGDADLHAVPAELREIVTRCLAEDPAARPTTDWLLDYLGEAAPGAAASVTQTDRRNPSKADPAPMRPEKPLPRPPDQDPPPSLAVPWWASQAPSSPAQDTVSPAQATPPPARAIPPPAQAAPPTAQAAPPPAQATPSPAQAAASAPKTARSSGLAAGSSKGAPSPRAAHEGGARSVGDSVSTARPAVSRRQRLYTAIAVVAVAWLGGVGWYIYDAVQGNGARVSNRPPQGSDCASGTINVAGAPGLTNAINSWTRAYAEKCPGAHVNYLGSGAGAAIQAFAQGQVALATPDRPLLQEETGPAASRCQGSQPLTLSLAKGGDLGSSKTYYAILCRAGTDQTQVRLIRAYLTYAVSSGGQGKLSQAGCSPLTDTELATTRSSLQGLG
jgi:serine/threonine protein kinase